MTEYNKSVLLAAFAACPFVIFSGSSGSGKTRSCLHLVRGFVRSGDAGECLAAGTCIQSRQAIYVVTHSSPELVEFVTEGQDRGRVVIPRPLICEWVSFLKKHPETQDMKDREIREAIKASGSYYANFMHGFETHLRAAARYVLQCQMNSELSFGSYCLIPVGADWTDNRHVLGYVNHLVRDKETDRPIYQTTPIVKLLLAADRDPEHPYFLILDEMNLSHVERYFADFLSKMESRDEIVFHSEDVSLKGSDGVEVPASIPCVPPNLFVIGTVNVDETTYMFSPKVLDRAQVIEFRVSPDEALAYLGSESGGSLPEPKPDEEAGRAFLELSLRARGLRQPALPDPDHLDELKTALGALFEMMHDWRMEFAYRTMNEVLRYARVSCELAEDKAAWSWQACLDTQILQKILPKLHGNKKRLEPVLMGLIKFCESGRPPDTATDYKTDLSSTAAVGRLAKPKEGEADPVVFRRSYEKLCDMLDAVRRDQYVSFIQ